LINMYASRHQHIGCIHFHHHTWDKKGCDTIIIGHHTFGSWCDVQHKNTIILHMVTSHCSQGNHTTHPFCKHGQEDIFHFQSLILILCLS
jgi:hypothetical protein